MVPVESQLLDLLETKKQLYDRLKNFEYISESEIYDPDKVDSYVEQVKETSRVIEELKNLLKELQKLYLKELKKLENLDKFEELTRKFCKVFLSMFSEQVADDQRLNEVLNSEISSECYGIWLSAQWNASCQLGKWAAWREWVFCRFENFRVIHEDAVFTYKMSFPVIDRDKWEDIKNVLRRG